MSRPSERKRAKQRARRERIRLQDGRSPGKRKTRTERVLQKIGDAWEAACDKAAKEGFPADVVYAMRKTGTMVTPEIANANHPDTAAWKAAILEYHETHRTLVDGQGVPIKTIRSERR